MGVHPLHLGPHGIEWLTIEMKGIWGITKEHGFELRKFEFQNDPTCSCEHHVGSIVQLGMIVVQALC